MSHINYGELGESELCYDIPVKRKLQHKNNNRVQKSIRDITENNEAKIEEKFIEKTWAVLIREMNIIEVFFSKKKMITNHCMNK